MEELYWITRLDSVFILLKVIMFISSLAIGFLGIVAISSIMEGYNDNDYDKEGRRLIKKMIKIASVVLVASAGMYILTPSTKDALMIWSVGGTIDWVKSNETAKQLPDKCVKALDKWVDSINENDSINNK